MKFIKISVVLSTVLMLSACALTPEQKAEREAKRVRAEQALQVQLAKQCDAETAELIYEGFNPPLNRSAKEEQAFNQRYANKVNDPMFQACYNLALQNYKTQQELQLMRSYYDEDYPRWGWGFGFSRFCYACW